MRLTLFCRHPDLVATLERELAWMRAQMIHERQRAERAIDTLLQLKIGVAPITVPTPQEIREHTEVFSGPGDPEFDQIGSLEDR